MTDPTQDQLDAWGRGHLTLEATRPSADIYLPPGIHGFAGHRDHRHEILVPERPGGEAGYPLLVFLHGATSNPSQALSMIADEANLRGIVVVATKSQDETWDVLHGGFGPDIVTMETALKLVADRLPIDFARLSIGGFSDGASYALSVGLSNGDLFRDTLALSPGFASAGVIRGRTRILISHGTADRILPIDPCSRRMVPILRSGGFEVDYREFEGGHTAPPDIIAAALDRIALRPASDRP